MSAKKVENPIEEIVNEEVKNTEEVAEQKTATSETQNTEEKNEEIIKEDEVIIEEENIISEDETKELKADEVKLKVLIAFSDKYTDEPYKVNDAIEVEEERAKELLADPRRLVAKLK
ncbi:MAG: hypothetical protein HFJ41_08415 [Clostridia bacterium]|nr:hypothetical protein [Clostridia bacterium]